MKKVLLIILILFTVTSILTMTYFKRDKNYPLPQLAVTDKDFLKSYQLAYKRAKQWHNNSFPTGIGLEIENNQLKSLLCNFDGSEPFGYFKMILIRVNLKDNKIESFKVIDEDRYQDKITVKIVKANHDWRQIYKYISKIPNYKSIDKDIYINFPTTKDREWVIFYKQKRVLFILTVNDDTLSYDINRANRPID